MKSNEISIGDAIKELIKTYRLKDKLSEVSLIHSWEGVVGPMIAKHTKQIYVRNKCLFVRLDSAALTNELKYSKERIVSALNKEIGEQLIDELIFR